MAKADSLTAKAILPSGVHLSGLVCLFSLAILQFAEEFLVSAVVKVQYNIDRKSL